ncbi:MAG: cytochrome-c peroxidase [Planctomycetota bacterium]|jgi:cytochrome c peroxidase
MRPGIWLSITTLTAAVAATLMVSTPPAEAQRVGSRTAIVELGRRLFLDPAASRAGKFSCASCHEPEHGFSDARRVSVDENGETSRHSQTLVDLRDETGFHWDGEFDHLHQLLTARLAPVAEVMAQTRELMKTHFASAARRGDRPSRREFDKKMRTLTPPYYGPDVPVSGTPRPLPQPILARLEGDGRYAEAFKLAYGTSKPTTERIIESMKAYLLSIKSGPNRFDDYLAGNPEALSAAERRGLRLFEGKAGCAQCHVAKPDSDGIAKFTDYTFRNTGVAFKKLKLDFDKQADIDAGLGRQTFAAADIGSFKVPTLRDVARRAPYMHDGSLKTLEEVVGYYEKGGTTNGRIDPKLHAFDLEKKEKADLVAFLHALSSKDRPGLGTPGRGRAQKIRVRLMGHDGKPMRALAVKVTPFGDRLRGAPRAVEPVAVTTDAQGYLEFPMPLWTHVKLSAPGYEIGYDRPLPDTLRKSLSLLTVPRRKVYVEVFKHPQGKALPAQLVGRAAGPARGAPNGGVKAITLRRVRNSGARSALYVADKPKNIKRLIVTFDMGANTAASLREIDTTGGMAEPLDFRQG